MLKISMAKKKKDPTDGLIIKRYGNRRLYNTETRSYVNYQDLIKMARAGDDFKVIDSKTGNAIVGASIKIMSTGKISTTSESGNVVMLISSEDSLLITAKGYKDRKLQMAGQFIALSIILDPVQVKDKIASKQKKRKSLKPHKS